jgi:NAD(P)-dependent dehydrogenase (short-subunit alcohol dehydrogenase family)
MGDHTAIVTGANHGIGAATPVALARRGCAVLCAFFQIEDPADGGVPQAFLMDEPLSNLDAKLRVSMRGSLSQLHERLGVTTVYVTHDQVEAMTLGKRVCVLRDGKRIELAIGASGLHFFDPDSGLAIGNPVDA